MLAVIFVFNRNIFLRLNLRQPIYLSRYKRLQKHGLSKSLKENCKSFLFAFLNKVLRKSLLVFSLLIKAISGNKLKIHKGVS